jgi:DNA-binding transcriptional regulator YhcF (GntR family)
MTQGSAVTQADAAAAPTPAPVWVQKFGAALMAAGYTVVPNIIVQRHKQLGLDAADLSIVMQLFSYWWKPDEWPFPSLPELGKGTGLNARNVQKRLKRMEKDNFIKIKKRKTRHGGWDTNMYDLSGLIKEATKLAVAEVARRKEATLAKLGKKAAPKVKPPLKVVKS